MSLFVLPDKRLGACALPLIGIWFVRPFGLPTDSHFATSRVCTFQLLVSFSVLFCSLRLGSQKLALCEAIREHFWFLIISTRDMQAIQAIFVHLGVACPMVRFNA